MELISEVRVPDSKTTHNSGTDSHGIMQMGRISISFILSSRCSFESRASKGCFASHDITCAVGGFLRHPLIVDGVNR